MADRLLVNRSTLGATDAVLSSSTPRSEGWSASLLGGRPLADRRTIATTMDGPTLPAMRAALSRPRVFWDGGNGRSAFFTGGRDRREPRRRHDDRRRAAGHRPAVRRGAGHAPLRRRRHRRRRCVDGRYVLTARGAAAWQRHDHSFGEIVERDRHDTAFAEAGAPRGAGRHTWVAGVAYERDDFDPPDTPQFAYTFNVPGIFAQDDVDLRRGCRCRSGARVDCARRVRHVLQPARRRVVPGRRVDQPRLGRAGLLRVHAADRGDRGRGLVAAHRDRPARGRARAERVLGPDPSASARCRSPPPCSRRGCRIRSPSIATIATRCSTATATRPTSARSCWRRGARDRYVGDRHLCLRPRAEQGDAGRRTSR